MRVKARSASLAALLVVVGTATAACGGGDDDNAASASSASGAASAPAANELKGKSISVVAGWGGAEGDAFKKVLNAFTQKTGVTVRYQVARDQALLTAVRTGVAGGNPPTFAILSTPGFIKELSQQDAIKPMSDLGLDDAALGSGYSKSVLDLGSFDGKLYALLMKANSKSTIWYKPASFKQLGVQVPKTWDDLMSVTQKYASSGKKPWAVGGKDNWTLTDWFEQVYIRENGPEKYQDLFDGKVKFTDATVKKAVTDMNSIVANDKFVAGGRQGVLGTAFVDGIGRVFGKKPDAEMYYEGGFVAGIATGQVNTALKPGADIDSFPWPTIDPQYQDVVVGGGDLLVAFSDKPEAKAFAQFMSTKQAGETWAATGQIISPNKQVDTSVYPNVLSKKEAEALSTAKIFRFDGSDLMPGSLGNDWGNALQGMVQNPGNVDKALQTFQGKADQAYNG